MSVKDLQAAVARIGLVERTNDPVGSLRKVYADAPDPVDALQRDESLIAGSLTDPRPLDRAVLVEEFGFAGGKLQVGHWLIDYPPLSDADFDFEVLDLRLEKGAWQYVHPCPRTIGDLNALLLRLSRDTNGGEG